jgi:hypothetical protein
MKGLRNKVGTLRLKMHSLAVARMVQLEGQILPATTQMPPSRAVHLIPYLLCSRSHEFIPGASKSSKQMPFESTYMTSAD